MNEILARQRCVGPMGSEFWRIEVSPEIVPALAEKADWNRMGRRVMIDAAKGIISWMSPPNAGSRLWKREARLGQKPSRRRRRPSWWWRSRRPASTATSRAATRRWASGRCGGPHPETAATGSRSRSST
ncbi:MAG: hypothetical protein OXI87_06175 [Albidovulum sp.]|nr:hypothetical protein [Albidovulum sp.]MDE0304458.1 hypothetical protein [Albidovulum sp.]MDE0533242.1 hypothetical protein [Albidovulum sp.]